MKTLLLLTALFAVSMAKAQTISYHKITINRKDYKSTGTIKITAKTIQFSPANTYHITKKGKKELADEGYYTVELSCRELKHPIIELLKPNGIICEVIIGNVSYIILD